MKIKAYINRVKTNYQQDFNNALSYFQKHGVDLSIAYENVDKQGLNASTVKLPQGYRTLLNYVLLPESDADIDIFVFDAGEFPLNNLPTSSCNYIAKKPIIYLSTDTRNPIGLDCNNICHELMHSLTYLGNIHGFNLLDIMDSYTLNDQRDNPLSNFGQQWTILAPFIASLKTASGYKYFSQKELDTFKLKDALWSLLDASRGISSIPYVLTSGFRSPDTNKMVGGTSKSTHLTGEGCDVSAKDSITRFKIIKGAIAAGFSRIGVYPNHIHLDIGKSPDYPQNVMWFNESD